MSREGVSIKVRIGLRANGHADHPNWDLLPLAASEKPENHQLVKWQYDRCGHDDVGLDSPVGTQLGMMVVTQQYADEAVARFPGIVSIMTEAEAEDFWNNYAHKGQADDQVDTTLLQGLQAELALRKELTQDVTALKVKIAKALDPDDDEPGIKKNRKRYWADAKAELDITLKAV